MTDAIPFIAFAAIVLAVSIGTLIGIHMQRNSIAAKREFYRRQLEARERSHQERKEIRRLYQRATTELLKQECRV